MKIAYLKPPLIIKVKVLYTFNKTDQRALLVFCDIIILLKEGRNINLNL